MNQFMVIDDESEVVIIADCNRITITEVDGTQHDMGANEVLELDAH